MIAKRLTRADERRVEAIQMPIALALNDPALAAIHPANLTVADLVRAARRRGVTVGLRLRHQPEVAEAYSPHAYRIGVEVGAHA